MKALLFFLTVCCLLSFRVQAQDNCNLIENIDPTLQSVSYQTVFATVVGKKDKFNIKFWRFKDKFAISCFVVTKDTFCVGAASSVTFNFNDGTRFTFISDKKQNCRGELNKDFSNKEMPGENSSLSQKKILSINISGIHTNKSFTVDERTAGLIQNSFNCISLKKIK